MASRTTQSVVSFSSPFQLPGWVASQPPGDYRIDQDEESIDGVFSLLAWRQVGAFIYLPAIAGQGLTQQMMPIRPADLDAALERDLQI